MLYKGYNLPGYLNKKLFEQQISPFKILRQVGKLAYKLDLLPY